MLWRGGRAVKSDAALRFLRHITGIATKRDHSARVLGPHPVPDDGRLGVEVARFQTLSRVVSDTPRSMTLQHGLWSMTAR